MLKKARGLYFGMIVLFSLSYYPFRESKGQSLRPNIVILLSDDHGAADTGFSGNLDVSTPVLDMLAGEGMVFTRAFAAASVCTPSRATLYTGLYPHRSGSHANHSRIAPGIKTLPTHLKEKGYRVALAGKVHVAPESSFPFEYLDQPEIPDFLVSVGTDPFCLIIAYNNPHEPFFNKKNGVSFSHIASKPWLPDTRETRKLTAAYYDNVGNLDQEIGTSLYWLERAGLMDNTMIIYTSDHGPGLPFAKWTLYEKALHVPLVITWKEVIPPGKRSHSLVSLADILPTLVELTGGPLPPDLDGKSILSIITGEQEGNPHDYLFASYTNLGVQDANRYPIRSVRNDKYKLILNPNHEEPFSLRITNRPDERAVVCAYRAMESWMEGGQAFAAERYKQFRYRPKIELYDLEKDPYELRNLAGQPGTEAIQKQLISTLKDWLRQQNDIIEDEI